MKEKEKLFNTHTGISIIVVGDQSLLEVSEEFIKKVGEINTFRGNIISLAISIEHRLNLSIEYLLFEVSNETSSNFQQIFLDNTYINFMDKYKIFLNLCKKRDGEKAVYIKNITKSIQKIIEIRNIGAHARFYYHIGKDFFYFKVYDNGIEIQKTIDGNYISKTIKELYTCINNLSDLINSEEFSTTKTLIPIKL